MTGFKYALMVLPRLTTDPDAFELAPNVSTFVGRLEEILDVERTSHWREWLGSTTWDEIRRKQRLLIVRAASELPGVLDHENNRLLGRLSRLKQCLFLAGPNALVYGYAWAFSGATASMEPHSRLLDVRTEQSVEPIVRPLYAHGERHDFWNAQETEDGWLDRWREIAALVELPRLPRLLDLALLSFERAFEPLNVEFKIPDAVRAIDAVIGLPKGTGAKEFARRVLKLVPELKNDRFVGGDDVEDRLAELYQHRSDCVHGKIPFVDLEALGEDGLSRVIKFDYMAEFAARKALVAALRSPVRNEVYATRASLESAWASETFPESVPTLE